ncbi:O-antigen ligase family protein [Bacillus thuringiensis]
MEIKKSTLMVVCLLIIIYFNERMFYTLEISNSINAIVLLGITVILFLFYIKSFITERFLFRGVILSYVVLNIISLTLTNVQFNQPIILALLRYKYVFVVLLYFPLCIMIEKAGVGKIKKVLITTTSILSIVYITQAMLYPDIVFLNLNYADRFGFTRFYDGAFFIVVGLFITISTLYNHEIKRGKLKYYFAFICQFSYLIFVAQTRSSIVPIVLIIMFVLISKLSVNNILSYFRIAALVVIGTLMLAPYFVNIFDSVKTDIGRSEGSAYIRVQAKEYMEEKILEYPIMGVGLYNAEYQEGKNINGSVNKYYAEDVGIIGFVFQYGFLGLLVYLGMMTRFFSLTYRISKYDKRKSILYLIFSGYLCTQIPFSIVMNVDNQLIYVVIFMALIQSDYNIVRSQNTKQVSI